MKPTSKNPVENPEEKKEDKTVLAKKEVSASERFTNMVIKQFSDTAGELKLTNFQKKLSQNYFIKLDQVLKAAEQRRLAKKEAYREKLSFEWKNVNMQKLAIDVVAYAGVGLDPTQANHINLIPYKGSASNQYDVGFIVGYKGKEIRARKYGLEVPDDIVVELVYSKDVFIQFKKDINNRVENYQFEVKDNFDRGTLVGGFYYHIFHNKPEKNKLRVFSKADIDKRKPDNASVEFWGGEKDKWEWSDEKQKNLKVGKEQVEGWYDEMAYKTIYSAAWNGVTIDSQKIDDAYVAVMQREREPIDARILKEIKENGNQGEAIGFEEEKTVQEPTAPDSNPVSMEESTEKEEEEAQEQNQKQESKGPNF